MVLDGTGGITTNSGTLLSTSDATISGLTVGKGGGSVSTNTAVGVNSFNSVTTGSNGTAIGYQAGYTNTIGLRVSYFGSQAGYYMTDENTGIGYRALYGASGSTGYYNVAVGRYALNVLTSGQNNVAVGDQALQNNTTSSNNTAVGYQALYSNTASNNLGIGYQASYTNQSGTRNIAIGNLALNTNTVSDNIGIGFYALGSNTTGAYNTAIGAYEAGGYSTMNNNTTGSYNVALGNAALAKNTTASQNTSVGYQSLFSNTTSGNSAALGYRAGYYSTGIGNTFVGHNAGLGDSGGFSGSYNTCIGEGSGVALTTGVGNCFVGAGYSNSGYFVTTGSKNTILGGYTGNQGGFDIRTASNQMVISDGDGNPFLFGQTYSNGLAWIANGNSGYRYVTWQMDIAGTYKSQIFWDNTNTNLYVQNASGGVYLTNTGTSWTANSDERLKENLTPIENGLNKVCSLRSVIGNFIADETKKPTPFLIAQDVQAVLPEAVTTSTIKDDESNTEYLGVAYTEVIPLLVASIKELKTIVDAQAAEIAELKAKVM